MACFYISFEFVDLGEDRLSQFADIWKNEDEAVKEEYRKRAKEIRERADEDLSKEEQVKLGYALFDIIKQLVCLHFLTSYMIII